MDEPPVNGDDSSRVAGSHDPALESSFPNAGSATPGSDETLSKDPLELHDELLHLYGVIQDLSTRHFPSAPSLLEENRDRYLKVLDALTATGAVATPLAPLPQTASAPPAQSPAGLVGTAKDRGAYDAPLALAMYVGAILVIVAAVLYELYETRAQAHGIGSVVAVVIPTLLFFGTGGVLVRKKIFPFISYPYMGLGALLLPVDGWAIYRSAVTVTTSQSELIALALVSFSCACAYALLAWRLRSLPYAYISAAAWVGAVMWGAGWGGSLVGTETALALWIVVLAVALCVSSEVRHAMRTSWGFTPAWEAPVWCALALFAVVEILILLSSWAGPYTLAGPSAIWGGVALLVVAVEVFARARGATTYAALWTWGCCAAIWGSFISFSGVIVAAGTTCDAVTFGCRSAEGVVLTGPTAWETIVIAAGSAVVIGAVSRLFARLGHATAALHASWAASVTLLGIALLGAGLLPITPPLPWWWVAAVVTLGVGGSMLATDTRTGVWERCALLVYGWAACVAAALAPPQSGWYLVGLLAVAAAVGWWRGAKVAPRESWRGRSRVAAVVALALASTVPVGNSWLHALLSLVVAAVLVATYFECHRAVVPFALMTASIEVIVQIGSALGLQHSALGPLVIAYGVLLVAVVMATIAIHHKEGPRIPLWAWCGAAGLAQLVAYALSFNQGTAGPATGWVVIAGAGTLMLWWLAQRSEIAAIASCIPLLYWPILVGTSGVGNAAVVIPCLIVGAAVISVWVVWLGTSVERRGGLVMLGLLWTIVIAGFGVHNIVSVGSVSAFGIAVATLPPLVVLFSNPWRANVWYRLGFFISAAASVAWWWAVLGDTGPQCDLVPFGVALLWWAIREDRSEGPASRAIQMWAEALGITIIMGTTAIQSLGPNAAQYETGFLLEAIAFLFGGPLLSRRSCVIGGGIALLLAVARAVALASHTYPMWEICAGLAILFLAVSTVGAVVVMGGERRGLGASWEQWR